MFKSGDESESTDESTGSVVPLWLTPVHTGHRAEQRCRQLGIPGTDPLSHALLAGASGYRAARGPIYPAAYAGERMWGETHADLARLLADHGWSTERIDGVDLMYHSVNNLAIIVTAGTPGTGYASLESPQARYERRSAIKKLVNEKPPSLFDDVQTEGSQVWFFMHHVTDTTLSGELSRPVIIGKNGLVNGWAERIIVALRDGGGRNAQPIATPSPAEPDIDIRVRRRTS
jgi:hypothetical protein